MNSTKARHETLGGMDATELTPAGAPPKHLGCLAGPLCPQPSANRHGPVDGAISGRCAPGVREIRLGPRRGDIEVDDRLGAEHGHRDCRYAGLVKGR